MIKSNLQDHHHVELMSPLDISEASIHSPSIVSVASSNLITIEADSYRSAKEDTSKNVSQNNLAIESVNGATCRLENIKAIDLVLGEDLKMLLKAYDISMEEITANYITGKGALVSKTTIQRYKNVTLKDIEGGQCYPKGVPARFMNWLVNYISTEHNLKLD